MELESDKQEITVRLLQNGRYTWSITLNTKRGDPAVIEQLKQMDGKLRDAFPNHVEKNSTRFQSIEE